MQHFIALSRTFQNAESRFMSEEQAFMQAYAKDSLTERDTEQNERQMMQSEEIYMSALMDATAVRTAHQFGYLLLPHRPSALDK